MPTPTLFKAENPHFHWRGVIGRRLAALTAQWILPAPDANPGMIAILRERNLKPSRSLVPWAGEFAGKYLTHAVQILNCTDQPTLEKRLARFVKELLSAQGADGYLGCWPDEYALTNRTAHLGLNWDTWAHSHLMLGLLLWHERTGERRALTACRRIADLLCTQYGPGRRPKLVETGNSEMNLAVIHPLCLLYRHTQTPRYLQLAVALAEQFGHREPDGTYSGGNYLEGPLAGLEFYQLPKPRWESLHPIMGLVELYWLTGQERYRQAFEALWRSMVKTDRHNSGGFTTGEAAIGTPFRNGAVETCCTVAWMAMSVEMLKLTGEPQVADEIELALYNAGLGFTNAAGRWVTYNTPDDGCREASAHTIVFQARPGTPELNCCSVNGPRVFGLVSEWALMRSAAGLVLNFYEAGTVQCLTPGGQQCRITLQTQYPYDPVIDLTVAVRRDEEFPLALRIPQWSGHTRVRLNGELLPTPEPGSYLTLQRNWRGRTSVRLELDFATRFWPHPQYPTRLWQADWHIIGPWTNTGNHPVQLTGDDLQWGSVTAPERIAAAAVATVTGARIDFNQLFPNAPCHSAAWCCCEVEVAEDCLCAVQPDCDWYFSCFVNGQPVATGQGNNAGAPVLELPLVKGKNQIAWLITGGMAGWNLLLRRGELPGESHHSAAAIYRGPLLLAYDAAYQPGAVDRLAVPVLATPELQPVPGTPTPLLAGTDTAGQPVYYCFFADAGVTGGYYQSWLPIAFAPTPLRF